MTFSDLHLITPLLEALERKGYKTPTPIQHQAIPPILDGRDLLGCAQTGTGKTAAFSLPILQLLEARKARPKKVRALILTPTRELAIQIDDNFRLYGKRLKQMPVCIFGGVNQYPQTAALAAHPEVVIATPGRLLDLYDQGYLDFQDLEIFVLDEADRMLDMGFLREVKKIISFLPEKRQNLLFSATMPPEIAELTKKILHNPAVVTVAPVSSTAERIEQFVFFTEKKSKPDLLVHLLSDQSLTRALVFTRTKYGADRLVKHLTKAGIRSAAIHGDKAQNARQRALQDFKSHKIRALVATDIAARGIDIDELPFVINYEVPEVPETYVHRIGRTGRAGREGIAVTFCDHAEFPDWKGILKLIGVEVETKVLKPFTIEPPSGSKSTDKGASSKKEKAPKAKVSSHRGQGPKEPRGERKSEESANRQQSVQSEGMVVFTHPDKGYGFIEETEGKKRVYFQKEGNIEQIAQGTQVRFERFKTPRGFAAKNIQILL